MLSRQISTLGLLAIVAAACGEDELEQSAADLGDYSHLNAEVKGDVVAVVNQQQIDSLVFQASAKRTKASDPSGLSLSEKQAVLDDLIDDTLLYQAALEAKLDEDPVIRAHMAQLLLKQEVDAQVSIADVTEEEGQAYFEAHKEDFYKATKVNPRMITIRVKDGSEVEAEAQIWEVYRELVAAQTAEREAKRTGEGQVIPFGKVFRDTAISSSQDSYRTRGGDLGQVEQTGRPGVAQVVVDQAFELPVDGISEPIQSEFGWHVVWVKTRTEAKKLTYQQYRSQVMTVLSKEKREARREEYLAGLRGRSIVTVDQDVLAAQQVRGQSSGRPTKESA